MSSDFIEQTKFGSKGNCLEACIASLTGIDLDTFPPSRDDGKDWCAKFNIWLAENHNLYIENVKYEKLDAFQRGISIASFQGNKNELAHAVLWDMNNNKMLFNPMPNNPLIAGEPDHFIILVNYYKTKTPSMGEEE